MIPEGWTADMTISIGSGQTHSDVADALLDLIEQGQNFETAIAEISRAFQLSDTDAELALDRAHGGIVRAMTGNPANSPSPEKDPIAFRTFEVVWNTFPRKGMFSRKREPTGKWLSWYEARSSS